MDTFLKWFVAVWVGLAILANIVAVAAIFINNGFWAGLSTVLEVYNPLNKLNVITEIVLLSPALLALWWRQKRRAGSVSEV